MRGKNHIQLGTVMGLTSYAVLVNQYPASDAMLCGLGCVLGSAFPDIDLPNTTISNHIPIFPKVFYALFGHRGFIHTPLCLLLIDIAYLHFLHNSMPALFFLLGFDLGFLAHLFQDMFTMKGIRFFYPIKYRISFSKRKSGSTMDTALTIVFCGVWLAIVPIMIPMAEKTLKIFI